MNLTLKYRVIRTVAPIIAASVLLQCLFPARAFALTSGPTTPEVQSFEPVTTNNMVDLFTGDFTYNLPLFELPGPNGSYPFNMAYKSGITMDQEASWVGLGWTLNPGVIERQMRGLPDEFNGEEIKVERDMAPNNIVGVEVGASLKLFGLDFTKLGSAGAFADFGVKLYYNSRTGFGYSIGANIDLELSKNIKVKLGLGLNADTQEGVDFSPSLSLTNAEGSINEGFKAGLSINSRNGLQGLTLGLANIVDKIRNTSFTFAVPASTPYVQSQTVSSNFRFSVKVGTGGGGLFGYYDFAGFFSTQDLIGRTRVFPAVGYNNLQYATTASLTDINRNKQVMLRKNTPNLSTPILTHDVYSVSAQGMSANVRPYRGDIGISHDPSLVSTSVGGRINVEFGNQHAGGGGGVNAGSTKSGKWEQYNDLQGVLGFRGTISSNKDYESVYYKSNGELSSNYLSHLEYIYGDGPVAINLSKAGVLEEYWKATANYRDRANNLVGNIYQKPFLERSSRNMVFRPQKNGEDALNVNSDPLFRVSHFETSANSFSPALSTTRNLDRSGYRASQYGGIEVVREDGMRYIYALPAYNHKQVEAQFSVDGSGICGPLVEIARNGNKIDHKVPQTDKYLNREEIPEYPYAYLLTSVVGTDYVDADTTPGPSEGDFGFWVKFNYVKVEDNFKWRAPFVNANYNEGYHAIFEDDKGSYMYGEKEVWYLASAETKTHIAEFYISRRRDSRGAKSELQNIADRNGNTNSGIQEGYSYKLDSTALFAKDQRYYPNGQLNTTARPITKVHMEYSYALCKNAFNNGLFREGNAVDPGSGKLTLKKMWVENLNNRRGQITPYIFDYHENNAAENPDYNSHAQNRWGNFKFITNICEDIRYPYVDQEQARSLLDVNAAAWNLKEITLPSGAVMKIKYEADDYAYVQDKQAMQMKAVAYLNDINQPATIPTQNYNENDPTQRRIHFELDNPTAIQNELDAYFRGVEQLYVKFRTDIKKPGSLPEYISGYLEIESYGFAGQTNGNGNYTQAYVQLKKPDGNGGKWAEYHPVALMNWQFLRANLPKIQANSSYNSQMDLSGANTESARKQRAKSLLNIFPQIAEMFQNYYKFARKKRWGSHIDLSQCWIRINKPIAKVGGGARVKQITLHDRWDEATDNLEDELVTGVVYDYTILEEGKLISSGVAQYEPMTGGDENPLRTAKKFIDNVPLKSPDGYFYEYPVNESYMPAPTIGYRKVTVKSLTADKVIKGQLAADIPTTGAAVHEFYTAKEFPVITDETQRQGGQYHLPVPIFGIGGITYDNTTMSQGYSIVLNDMHGKPKMVSNYKQGQDGRIVDNKISWVKYNYHAKPLSTNQGNETFELENKVNVLKFDVDPNDLSQSWITKKILGQEHEFITEMQESISINSSIGLDVNVELFGIIPIPFPWPTLQQSKAVARTAVTNKIIHRSGILKSMEAWNEGSLITTNNVLYDEQTGRPLLTTVTNDYDDPVYNYEYPAFWAYDGMGAAYKNIGIKFDGTSQPSTVPRVKYLDTGFLNGQEDELLVPGDEFIVTSYAGNTAISAQKAVYVSKTTSPDRYHFFFEQALPNSSTSQVFELVRSGRRNMLATSIQQVTSLKDPTRDRYWLSCFKDLADPQYVLDTIITNQIVTLDTVIDPCLENLFELMSLYHSQPTSHSTANFISFPYRTIWQQGCGLKGFSVEPFTSYSTGACEFLVIDSVGTLFPSSLVNGYSNLRYFPVAPNTIGPVNATYLQLCVDVYTTNGPNTGYIFVDSSCHFQPPQIISDTQDVLQTQLIDSSRINTVGDTLFFIDSVLNIAATPFSDAWYQSFNEVRFPKGNAQTQLNRLENLHPFLNGERGIWRPKDTYVYVDKRGQSNQPNLAKDGTFSNTPLFSFQSAIFDYCAPQWRHVSEVTKYSPYSYEVENRDILDIYSSALYGYNGKVPVAVAANARNTEIGYESFEEYDVGAAISPASTTTGNLEIYNSSPSLTPNYTYEQVEALYGIALQIITVSPMPVIASGYIKLAGRSHGSIFDPAQSYVGKETSPTVSPVGVTLTKEPYFHEKAPGTPWRGNILVPKPYIPYNGALAPGIEITDVRSHTGKHAMRITENVAIPQNRFLPRQGRKYTVQAWVSKTNTNVPFYKDHSINPADHLGIKVYFLDSLGNTVSSTNVFKPQGRMINGWQKIEGNFEMPANARRVKVGFQSGTISTARDYAYFDDIRIQPFKSKMTTYVYDEEYRLEAQLDDDNFAMLYHYDEGGNLFLVEKETIEGWKTLQESRAFLIER